MVDSKRVIRKVCNEKGVNEQALAALMGWTPSQAKARLAGHVEVTPDECHQIAGIAGMTYGTLMTLLKIGY